MKFNFKGFGTTKKTLSPELKEAMQLIDAQSHGYKWLVSNTSNDKEASQKLAQFVMRCLGFVKKQDSSIGRGEKMSKKRLDLFQMQFARMLAYNFYAQMAVALAEIEPTGVEGMSIHKTICALCEATDEQLQNLDKMFPVA
jgi:hypothetical protein